MNSSNPFMKPNFNVVRKTDIKKPGMTEIRYEFLLSFGITFLREFSHYSEIYASE